MLNLAKPRVNRTGAAGAGSHSSVGAAGSRRRLAAAACVLASLLWIGGLAVLGYAQPALPWCITLAITACGAIISSKQSAAPQAPAAVVAAGKQPMSFLESYAITYLAASCILSGWIIFHLFHKMPPPAVKRQIVDIELTSLHDYLNRHDPLPGTREKATLRKRTAFTFHARGSLVIPATATRILQAPPAENSTTVKEQKHQQPVQQPTLPQARMIVMQALKPANSPVYAANQHFLPPFYKSTRQAVSPDRTQTKADDRPFLEEVEPPEMVEMLDNDGQTTSLDVWQDGGSSSGGAGAKSSLAVYLKDLNHKIKSIWSPPRGQAWKTEILFRIAKSGRLVSARVIASSGNAGADEAALQSVVAAAPFKELPADYRHEYLDLHYSFNYNVDELTETTRAPLE